MMHNLKIRHDHSNAATPAFGARKLSGYVLDRMIEQKERTETKNRKYCTSCFVLMSVTNECINCY